ncbi:MULTISPECIES: hypothetical protein [Acidithiobacillus]|uniref:Uncharacterized protein n=2 Tax=Acidithiobacillus TaxID=119977 RepID=A0A179BPQ3_ACIFR|nr:MULTISPECIES: hypothetical protein [Acidithiobacillus]MEB8476684.1 hypothetical protein [Acidithiobacillus ferriphilus]MEB8485991.1 hypothetical protein [Acidithiobacillus ferriphilus]MEB8489604.1 hypothetical protein [Acidithiobacillus ferriphilus]MEB8492489.1 hypothetical protein [Acidithiobacillus ferriphilus]MEB8515428.1 hypothetical protein [Acidithiobacillus ferriphilus]
MYQQNKTEALDFLRQNMNHVKLGNSRHFTWVYISTNQPINTIGLRTDYKPFEGTVIAADARFVAFRLGRKAAFNVMDRGCLPSVTPYAVDEKLLVTPYAHKDFDGRRLDEPTEEIGEHGCIVRTIIIGLTNVKIPLPTVPESFFIKEIVEQLESVTTDHGLRTAAQVLADAGAGAEPVQFLDDDEAARPWMQFAIRTDKLHGYLKITLDRALDYYEISTTNTDGETVEECKEVDFTSLAEVIQEMVDDGNWRIAEVKVLKRAA